MSYGPPFNFSYRDGYFDWRLIHGIDADSVVRLTDIHAIEDCLHCIQHGNLGSEKGLSIKNCVQVFRLLQLAIEYVSHLRSTHAALIGSHDAAAAAAEGWQQAASSYLDACNVLVEECRQLSAMSVQRLELVDSIRAQLQDWDRRYNQALDQLEAEDQQARYFHFRQQRSELNWRIIHAVDLEELQGNVDTATLDKVLHNITFGNILSEDSEELTPHHFSQLVPLAQCALDYVVYEANVSGTQLERAMARLHAACAGIPALTSATEAMHARVSALALEAGGAKQQADAGPRAAAGTGTGPGAAWPSAATMPLQSDLGGSYPWGPTPDPRASALPAFFSAPVPAPGSASASAAAAVHQGLLHLYDDLLAGASGSQLLPVLHMQSHTNELHGKVDDLERDLRMERYKTDEMRRLLTDIRERLHSPGASQRPLNPQPSPGLSPRPSNEPREWQLGSEAGGAGGGGPGGMHSPFATPGSMLAVQQALGWGAAGAATSTTMTQTGMLAFAGSTLDEGAIRGEERRKTLLLLQAQIEFVKQETQRQVARRRQAGSSPGIKAAGSGSGSGAGGPTRKPRPEGAAAQATRSSPSTREDPAGGAGLVSRASEGGSSRASARGRPPKPSPKKMLPPGMRPGAARSEMQLTDTDAASNSPVDDSLNSSAGPPPAAPLAGPAGSGPGLSRAPSQGRGRAAGPLARGLARSSRLSSQGLASQVGPPGPSPFRRPEAQPRVQSQGGTAGEG